MDSPIRFGTLGAATITPGALIAPVAEHSDVEVVAVAARDRGRAEKFAKTHGIRDVVDGYQDVIDHPDVDVIYNPLTPASHKEWTIKALRAGKPVLCEKPFAANAAEAEEMARVAEETGLVLMEAFHYRYHPVFQRAAEIVREGTIGAVKVYRGRFLVRVPSGTDNFRMQYAPGGGSTMDMGCYPLSWARHLWGEVPEVVSASAVEGPPGVDPSMSVRLRYPSGAEGFVEGSMAPDAPQYVSDIVAEGERGVLKVTNPLVPHLGHQIELTTSGGTKTETLTRRASYAFQLDVFVDAVRNGTPVITDPRDAVEGMRLIDDCYRAAGLPLRGHELE